MVKSHHLYHSSHSDRQSKHTMYFEISVCLPACLPGVGGTLVGFGWGRSDSGSAPPVYSKCYKRPKRGIETKHFAKFWRIRGSKYDISIFFSQTGVKLLQFSKDPKGVKIAAYYGPSYIVSTLPGGCLSIIWKGYWVYGVLFRVPRVLYRNLSVVCIWKLSVLVMWCKLVKTFRIERLP